MTTSGWQGLYSREYTDLPLGYGSLTVSKNPNRNRIKRVINRDSFRVMTELLNTLLGAGVGAAALATHKRIAATVKSSGPQGGGAVTIETVTDINRVSAAADLTAANEMLFGVSVKPASYINNSTINPR